MLSDQQRNAIRAIQLLMSSHHLEFDAARGTWQSTAPPPEQESHFRPGDVVVVQEGRSGHMTYFRGPDDHSWRSEVGAHPPQDARLYALIQSGRARLAVRDGNPVPR